MEAAKFGPAGNGNAFYAAGGKRTAEAPAWLEKLGLSAYEYQCGNGVRGTEAVFRAVGEAGKLHGIALSLHAPYYISLSGTDPEKRLNSLHYIRESVQAARWMGADTIVIHTGSAAKITRAEAMTLAKDTLYKTLEAVDCTDVILGLETMGKVNQLGTLEEVVELCTLSERLRPVVDFGHLNARDRGVFHTSDDYRRIFDTIACGLGDAAAKYLHCHFSKIEYTAAGEKKHLTFADTVYGPDPEPLMDAIAREGLCPRILCESEGTQAEDALAMQALYRGFCAKG